VVQAFSKSFGLAGLRLSFATSEGLLAEALERLAAGLVQGP
jgi:histidinol-phosphate/aromatic aminotransferase/cobyric acid decarboxylase-like protein